MAPTTKHSTVEHEWAVELPAATPEQLLAALAARDRLFGYTIVLEPEEDAKNSVEVWFGTVEALEEGNFVLSIHAEMTGPKQYLEAAQEALEDIVGEQIEEGATEVGEATVLARRPASEVTFRKVAEAEDAPQLVIPEWLLPQEDESELPIGFRPFDAKGKAWPDDKTMAKHERIVVLPVGDELVLYALPAIEDGDEA